MMNVGSRQPLKAGGDDIGPTTTELVVAGLGG
jgi:hypothetical protein